MMIRARGPWKAQVRNLLMLACTLGLGPWALSGCGYSLSGRGSFLPDYIKVIAVPQFVNQTGVYDLDREVSDRVRRELAGHGRYKVTPETAGADAVLTGVLKNATLLVTATSNNVASRYAVVITASVEFKDMKADKVLWTAQAMQFREEYPVTSPFTSNDVASFLTQQQGALVRLADNFAKSTVTSILEAF
jgi:lipopolysaccharide assembly LptE-like protein